MREPKLCPGCGFRRFGSCPFCFPQAAEREKAAELAEWRREQEQERRRREGQMFCPAHAERDGCVRLATPEERSAGRDGPLSWEAAMRRLRERYVSP